MLSQLFQPSDQRPDYIKCCSIQAYYKDFTAHSLITSSTISFNFLRLFSTGNIFLFFPLLLSLYQSSTFQYDDTSNIFSCYGFISRNLPHDKFVEAYVREDAEHACESESEREYAVAFRMKIPRSVYNECERENLADDVPEEPNMRVLRYPSYRAHTTSYFPFANARMRPKYFFVVCVRMRKMCICDEI